MLFDMLGISSDYPALEENGAVTDYNVDYIATGAIIIPTTSGGKVTEVRGGSGAISVASTTLNPVIVLNNVNRSGTTSQLQISNPGNSTVVVLPDGTSNSFTCTGTSTTSGAVQSGIRCQGTEQIIIKGQFYNTGVLTAKGGAESPGIGGYYGTTACGTVRIYGGRVTATGGTSGAGIGGGYHVTGGTKVISGKAVVTANGTGNAAGAGGGAGAYAGGTTSVRQNGTLNANSGNSNAAGAGGGGGSSAAGGGGGSVLVQDNGILNAKSYSDGAGIGGGGSDGGAAGGGATVTISGGITVATTGSARTNSRDIGAGVNNSNVTGAGGTTTITSGSVNPTKGRFNPRPTNGSANGSNALYKTTVNVWDVKTSTPIAGATLTIQVTVSAGTYTYTANTNASGLAYIWLPSGLTVTIVGTHPDYTSTGIATYTTVGSDAGTTGLGI